MSQIDFVGIGAPKCGTTWISAQLGAHPQIGFAPDKEVYYFANTIFRRIAGAELRCFERGEAWYHEQFPPAGGAVLCRGEFCPAYLYSEQAAAKIATYRPDIKLLLCLRPVEMIYSWYRYNRNDVIASLPDSFAELMENPFLRDLGCFGRHLRPYLERFPAKNILVIQFDAIRRDPDRVRQEIYQFLEVAADFRPRLPPEAKNAARAPRFPLLQSCAQRLYARLSAMPRAGKLLLSPTVAKTLQTVYHLFNTKARKYEPLAPEERLKWEAYYAMDQNELTDWLQGLQVVD